MRIILIYSLLMCAVAQAQTIVSLDDALSIAMQNSPQIKQAELNLERSSQSLKAQRAALKSNFSLSINPYSYSYDRRYDRFRNLWYTSENTSSSADFRIRQPILLTDGTFSTAKPPGPRPSYARDQRWAATILAPAAAAKNTRSAAAGHKGSDSGGPINQCRIPCSR